MANRYMKYHPALVRMTIIKESKITSVGKDVKKTESLYTIGRKINWCSLYGKHYGDSSKN